jgi:hypothetical protein
MQGKLAFVKLSIFSAVWVKLISLNCSDTDYVSFNYKAR